MIDPIDTKTPDLFQGEAPDPLDFPAAAQEIPPERLPRQFADLTDYLEDELRRALSLDVPQSRQIAFRLVARMADEFNGTQLYLPKRDALQRVLRDLQIWAEYDGTPHGKNGVEALAKRWDLTSIATYRIIATQRALHRRAVQGDLFNA